MSEKNNETYVYDQLFSSNSIRLFRLLPGPKGSSVFGALRSVELAEDADTAPGYTALSYTWGSSLEKPSPIWIDGKPFPVRENLLKALEALRDPQRSTTLWIDALCINQKDVYEKSHQVGLMARIYRTAESVKVWLGTGDDGSVLAFKYMQNGPGNDDITINTAEGSPIAPTEAIRAILQHNYWSRAWIIQEITLARAIQIHCGTSVLSWDKFAETCKSLRSHLPVERILRLVNQRMTVLSDERLLLGQTLESLVRTYNESECSDRRDRVFALLSLASDCAFGQGMRANYGLPRLELLVQVLEFCRPDDPIDFISLLFRAFTRGDGDEAWQTAVDKWNQARFSPSTFSDPLEIDAAPMGKRMVQITQLVTASSSSRDWARHYSCVALLDPDFVMVNFEKDPSLTAMFIHQRSKAATSKKYCDVVCRIDDTNLAVIVHEAHFIVLSTTQIMAAVNPCTFLGLHGESFGCIRGRCAGLKTFER